MIPPNLIYRDSSIKPPLGKGGSFSKKWSPLNPPLFKGVGGIERGQSSRDAFVYTQGAEFSIIGRDIVLVKMLLLSKNTQGFLALRLGLGAYPLILEAEPRSGDSQAEPGNQGAWEFLAPRLCLGAGPEALPQHSGGGASLGGFPGGAWEPGELWGG
jgi:hypothetical protein